MRSSTIAARRASLEAIWPNKALWAAWIAFVVASGWPASNLRPLPINDDTPTGLHLARIDGLHWGSHAVFSFGPLGFLLSPKVFSLTDLIFPVLYYALLLGSFACVLTWQLHRRYGAPVAFIGALALISLLPVPGHLSLLIDPNWVAEVALLTGTAVAVSAAAGELSPTCTRWLPAAFGAAAAVQLLVKFNTGVGLGVLGAVLALTEAGRLRKVLELFYSFVGVFLLCWLCLGQPVGNIPVWLHRTLSEALGYSSAMSDEWPHRHVDYVAAGCLVAAIVAIGWRGIAVSRDLPRWRLALVAAVGGWFFFKEAFLRHDSVHAVLFFAFAAVLVAAVPWRARWRLPALGAFIAACGVGIAASGLSVFAVVDPGPSLRALGRDVAAVVSSSERRARLAEARGEIRSAIAIPQDIVDRVGDQPVHLESSNAPIVWAYGFNWRPLPLYFAPYGAYTRTLDVADSRALVAPNGPARVLRLNEYPIDFRYATEQSPEYTLALVCNFVQLGAEGVWQVLGRGVDRCGQPRPLGEAKLREGAPVAIPRPSVPGAIVIGRIHLQPSLGARLREFLFKLPPSRLVVDGVPYRLVPGTADGPTILRLPNSVGWSPTFGPIDASSIGLTDYSGSARISFFEIPVS